MIPVIPNFKNMQIYRQKVDLMLPRQRVGGGWLEMWRDC